MLKKKKKTCQAANIFKYFITLTEFFFLQVSTFLVNEMQLLKGF